jgi:hypothetical protein
LSGSYHADASNTIVCPGLESANAIVFFTTLLITATGLWFAELNGCTHWLMRTLESAKKRCRHLKISIGERVDSEAVPI